MSSPFLLLTPALALGIFLATWLAPWCGFALVALALALYLTLLSLQRDPVRCVTLQRFHWIWTAILFVGIGNVAAGFSRPDIYPLDTLKTPVEALVTDVVAGSEGDRLTVEIAGTKGIVRSDAVLVSKGDVIVLIPSFRPVERNLNLFEDPYSDTMRRKGIFYSMHAPGTSLRVIGHRESVRLAAESARDDVEEFISMSGLRHETKGFIITMMLGSKGYVSDDVRSLFSDAGIAHLLALSGMHVAIVAGIIMGVLFPINFFGMYRWRYVLVIILLWGYTFFTGMAVSTVRASLMASFAFTALLLERRHSVANGLMASAFVILLFSPDSLYDIGAQLSFISVGALVAFMGPFNTVDHRAHPRLYVAVGAVLTSLVSTAAVWPLVSWSFGRVPLLFLPVNIVVLPLLPFYIGIALLYFLFHAAGITLEPLVFLLDGGYALLTESCRIVSGGGSSSLPLRVPEMTVVLWCLAIVVAAVGIRKVGRDRRFNFAISCILAVAAVCVACPAVAGGTPDAFIVQNHVRDIGILSRAGGRELQQVIPRYGIYRFRHVRRNILVIDCGLPDSFPEALSHRFDYLIIGAGYKGKLADLISILKVDTVVLHHSLRKKREGLLLEEAKVLGVAAHSLRLHGPLRVGCTNK